jgi:hypothetical protein
MEFEGDVTISSDGEVMDYYAYDKITGNLVIESTDVTKLNLPELKELGGSLIITYNEFLTDINELNGLKSIGGDFKVTFNDGLSEVSVQKLRDAIQEAGGIKGQVTIEGNLSDGVAPGDACFEGDAKIASDSDVLLYASFSKITGKLHIGGMQVTSIKLPNLREVGGDVEIMGTALRTLSGLDSLETVGGELSIMDNASIRDITLPELATVSKSFIIRDNGSLDSLGNFEKLSKVGEELEVVFNRDLLTSQIEEVAERLKGSSSVGGEVTISNNLGF